MTVRSLLVSLVALALTASAALSNVDPRLPYDRASFGKTCTHYMNRARFKPRQANAPLDVLLADSCMSALNRLATRPGISPYESKRARIYLEHLTAYKSLIINMNVAGFAKARQDALHGNKLPVFGRASPRVSEAGEFLIARQMGLLEVYEDWAKASNFETAVAVLTR